MRKIKKKSVTLSREKKTQKQMTDIALKQAKNFVNVHKDEIENDAAGKMLIVFCGYLRIMLNFNKGNMQDFLTDFTRFFSMASDGDTSFQSIGELLKEEIDFDIEQEFSRASSIVDMEEKNYNEIRNRLRHEQLSSKIVRELKKRVEGVDSDYETSIETSR